jgi:hypothetical protein
MGKPNWTESEMAYLTQHYEKTDNKTIGIALGRSQASISAKGISMGLVKCMVAVNQSRSESCRVAANHKDSTDKWCEMGLVFVPSLAGHPSFEAYRSTSRVYQLDSLLRGAA